MIAVNPNVSVKREDRSYACDLCGEAFERSVAINGYGELVGGDVNRPRRCSTCKGKSRFDAGRQVTKECVVCGDSFTYQRTIGPGRQRLRCPHCSAIGRIKKAPRKCKRCGSECENGLKAFCSEQCRQEQRQDIRANSGKHECPSCGKLCLGALCRKCWKKGQVDGAIDRAKGRRVVRVTPEQRVGRIGEAYFDLIAASEGWRVFIPQGDNTPGVDRVVAFDDRTATVQIKASRSLKAPRYQFMGGKGCDADLLCVINLESGDMWLTELAKGQQSVSLDGATPWNYCLNARGSVWGAASALDA